MKECLEISGSVANFAGGLVLLYDALRIRKSIREKSGASTFLRAMKQTGGENLVRDEKGRSLTSEEAVEIWLSSRSLKRAWIGFGLMVVGFACEILSHLFQ